VGVLVVPAGEQVSGAAGELGRDALE